MSDIYIFGFGFAVFLLIGSALTTLIIINNRALEAAEQDQTLSLRVARERILAERATHSERSARAD